MFFSYIKEYWRQILDSVTHILIFNFLLLVFPMKATPGIATSKNDSIMEWPNYPLNSINSAIFKSMSPESNVNTHHDSPQKQWSNSKKNSGLWLKGITQLGVTMQCPLAQKIPGIGLMTPEALPPQLRNSKPGFYRKSTAVP